MKKKIIKMWKPKGKTQINYKNKQQQYDLKNFILK